MIGQLYHPGFSTGVYTRDFEFPYADLIPIL
jgi:hypothetical protein